MKKLFIKLLGLHDVSKLLLEAKQKQKAMDDKYWHEIIAETEMRMKQQHSLELQEKDSCIAMLNAHIDNYRAKEKEINQREFSVRKQIKENYMVAQGLSARVGDLSESIGKIYGELLGLQDSADRHKRQIEGKR